MTELTQKLVDHVFAENKAIWDQMVRDSGMAEGEFILKSKDAMDFLTQYAEAKEMVEAAGFVMPVLVEGLQVSLVDDDAPSYLHLSQEAALMGEVLTNSPLLREAVACFPELYALGLVEEMRGCVLLTEKGWEVFGDETKKVN